MENLEVKTNNATGAITPPEENGAQGGKLFTQEEVNKIVSERLNRERAKAEPTEQEKRESDLSLREIRLACKEYLMEKGYNKELLDIIDTSDFDTFSKTVDKLAGLKQPVNENLPRFTASITPPQDSNDKIAEAFKPKI